VVGEAEKITLQPALSPSELQALLAPTHGQ
jgi:hypothetical protein